MFLVIAAGIWNVFSQFQNGVAAGMLSVAAFVVTVIAAYIKLTVRENKSNHWRCINSFYNIALKY